MLGKRKERSAMEPPPPKGDVEKAGNRLAKKAEECTTSRYRGVTKHRRSGRWESHIWAAAKGKQIYLGGYELEEHAASAYDVARLKIKGRTAKTNFDISNYTELLEYLELVTLDELVTAVRKQSQGFAKCPTGVKWITKHASGKWEAKALVGSCSKFINLGLFDSEYAAVTAYHKAMTKMSGKNNSTITSAMQSANVHYSQKYKDSPKALEALQSAVHPALLVKAVPAERNTTTSLQQTKGADAYREKAENPRLSTSSNPLPLQQQVVNPSATAPLLVAPSFSSLFPKMMNVPNSVENSVSIANTKSTIQQQQERSITTAPAANVSLSSTLASLIQMPSDFKFLNASTSQASSKQNNIATTNILHQTSGNSANSVGAAANLIQQQQQQQLQLLASLTSQSQKELALHFHQKLLKGDK
jgi:hypothetical protein